MELPIFISALLLFFILFCMIAHYFYTQVRASLLEYLLILVAATIPYGVIAGRIRDYTDSFQNRLVEIFLSVPLGLMMLYSASKGLNWAERRGIRNAWPRLGLMLLSCQMIPAILWQFPFLVMLANGFSENQY